MATTSVIDVVMPQMGVSVSEGTITKWLKQEGETVEVGTKLAVIAPAGAEVAAPEAAPEPEAEAEQAPPEPATQEAAAAAAAPSSSEGETPTAAPPPAPAETPAPAAAPAPAEASDGAGERTFVSPVVARIASEHGVDVGQVQGTGRGGRVTKKDIMSFVESGGPAAAPEAPAAAPETPPPATEPAAPAAPPEPPPAPAPAAPPAPQAAPAPPKPAPAPEPVAAGAGPGETVEPMTAMRRGIAEHMRRSLDTSAHVTTVFEIDMSKVVAIRKKLKPEYERSYGVNPTYLAFIARATIEAMKNWPWVNAEIRGEQIVRKNYVNLGIAVALEGGQGLIVPVVKNAEGLNLLGIARAVADIADRARNKKLTPDDVQGGTFTITNPGGWGAIIGTPIISQPQVAILDVEALVKRAVVVQDEGGQDVIAIRPMMNLCLSYDHRLVDGAYAAQFMKELRENLETFDEGAY